MKFKDFYKLIEGSQEVSIQCYCGEKPTEDKFEGAILDTPIYMGEYELYCDNIEAVSTSIKNDEVIMYIDLQIKEK